MTPTLNRASSWATAVAEAGGCTCHYGGVHFPFYPYTGPSAEWAEASEASETLAPVEVLEAVNPGGTSVPSTEPVDSLLHPDTATDPPASNKPSVLPGPTLGWAHRLLRERCPACFGLETWGRPLSEGNDVQLSADGCFSYRHLRSAGDGLISYDPSYFISKEKVDTIRERIATTRRQKPAPITPSISQEAIDACEASRDAANEKKQKPTGGRRP
ncbi:hypothetical protein B0H17DRAFT_1139544 [Mycena rosella]|uniref:Uncharacterized protein n=1 Tax=Mycena rosella TaxID=1033263 RepID=A0AAD7D3U3_MYCRO|nr:hypothetical protein B0H17DRAFT_1139544 [Mycena rosella]